MTYALTLTTILLTFMLLSLLLKNRHVTILLAMANIMVGIYHLSTHTTPTVIQQMSIVLIGISAYILLIKTQWW